MSKSREVRGPVLRPIRRGIAMGRVIAWGLVALFASTLSSCVYYNTFYLAKKNYFRSLNDVPYPVDKTDLTQQPQFAKSIEYSKKVVESYPKSKWVDDAYLLWARGLIANDD